jgi:hypothetical protein
MALGRVVEGLCQSRFWPWSCILVIEDDLQDGFDHVALFPNSTTRVLHSMELIVGLSLITQFNAMAPAMLDMSTDSHDLNPYARDRLRLRSTK